MSSLSSKSLYLLFNQNINDNSSPTLTPWHDRGYFPSSLHIPWRAIYQPPTSKKEGDVQYKLLHNVLPSLPVLHHLNSNISSDCGWCGERGTITHLFITCPSIQPALNLLHSLISRLLPNLQLNFDIYWTLVPPARSRNKGAVRLANYLSVSLKNVIYWLYRTSNPSDPLLVWQYRLKNKIILEFNYHRLNNSIPLFLTNWSINNTLFDYSNDRMIWLI